MDDVAITREEAKTITSKDGSEDLPPPADTYGGSKPSRDLLRSAQPAQDLTVTGVKSEGKPQTSKLNAPGDVAKIETVFEKLEVTDKTDSVTESVAKKANDRTHSNPLFKEDNMFSTEMNNTNNNPASASIYSVTGTPSARINRRRTNSSSVFPVGCMGCKEDDISLNDKTSSTRRFLDAKEATSCTGQIDNTPKKRSSSAQLDSQRNPLTGAGVEGVVETRRSAIRRKDGNPLLGLGYEESDASISPSSGSSNRVPPGGYSHGLW